MAGWLCCIVLVVSAAALAYQDFKTRLISVWLIVLFAVSCIAYFLLSHSIYTLLENATFCGCYFLLCYFVLLLYFFLRTGAFVRLLNDKIGWGDIWLLLIIGSCLSPQELLFFFTATFLIAIGSYFLLRKKQTIALAGILLICYCLQLAWENQSVIF